MIDRKVTQDGVFRASAGDMPRLAAVFRRSFHDEPVQKWLFSNPYWRATATGLWFRGMLHQAASEGEVWRFWDNSSAAVWFRPGSQGRRTRYEDALFNAVTALNRRAVPIKAELDRELENRRPRYPHWYLSAVATDANVRRQGRGTLVLSPMLERCNLEQVPAYLETSEPKSLLFYARLGFAVSSFFSLRGGPQVWCMIRDPKGIAHHASNISS